MVLKMIIAEVAAMAGRGMALPSGTGALRNAASVVSSAPSNLDMQPSPIEPDWIISGTPHARMAQHSLSHDRASYTALWDCTAGTFRWHFGWDETVHIVEGEVHVTADDGTVHILRAGDVAYFKAGSWATWRVDNYVRKVAFLRRPFPRPLAFVYRVANKLLRMRSRSL